MKKKAISTILILLILISFLPTFSNTTHAAVVYPNSLYLKQEPGSVTCTLVSAVMMIRARFYLSSNSYWSSITESNTRPYAWDERKDGGLRNEFDHSINGNYFKVNRTWVYGLSIDNVRNILNSHPEGFVLFCEGLPHAVYITDVENGVIYCADPGPNFGGKRIPLSSSWLGSNYGNQETILKNVSSYWYISYYSISVDDYPAIPTFSCETGYNKIYFNINPCEGASHFDVYIYNDDGIIIDSKMGITSQTYSHSISPGTYSVNVYSVDSTSGNYKSGIPKKVTVANTDPDMPTYSCTVDNGKINFVFNPCEGASYFDVYIYNAAGEIIDSKRGITSQTYSHPISPGTHSVNVYSVNSTSGSYKGGTPQMIPDIPTYLCTAGKGKIYFNINPCVGASYFDIYIYNDAGEIIDSNRKITSQTYSYSLSPGTYSVNVFSVNSTSGSYQGGIPQKVTVTNTNPDAPTYSCTTGNGKINFVFNPCEGASYFDVYIYNAAGEIIDSKMGITSQTYSHSISPGTYSVNVYSVNSTSGNYKSGIPQKVTVTYCNHSYSSVVTSPTCSEQGYTTYTCKFCRHSYTDNYVEAKHIYVSTYDATCEKCDFVREIALPEISAVSMTLYNSLAYNVKVLENLEGINAVVTFNIAGKTYSVKDFVYKDGYSVFTLKDIGPQYMTDIITAVLTYEINGEKYTAESYNTSLSDYCMSISQNDESYKNLTNAVLNYGAAAQQYKNYKTDNLANTSLSEDEKAVSVGNYKNAINKEYFTIKNPKASFKHYGLIVDDKAVIKLSFETSEKIENLSIKVKNQLTDEAVVIENFKKEGNKYTFYFDAFNIDSLDEVFLFTVYEGQNAVSDTLSYSVESYASKAVTTNDSLLINLIHALMNYGTVAKNY